MEYFFCTDMALNSLQIEHIRQRQEIDVEEAGCGAGEDWGGGERKEHMELEGNRRGQIGSVDRRAQISGGARCSGGVCACLGG